MRTFDCFPFFNELDLLALRLAELDSVVDYFVISEAPVTFQGRSKPLHFAEAASRFAAYAHKIRHVIVDDMPGGDDPWKRELHQRNALRRGLSDASPDDYVLISDADEIVTPVALRQGVALNSFAWYEQRLAVYYLNMEVTERPTGLWSKVYGAPWKEIEALSDLSQPRFAEPAHFRTIGQPIPHAIIANAGWQFSWMGGIDGMLDKLKATSHTEERVQEWYAPEKLRKAMEDGVYFAEGARIAPVKLTELPEYVTANQRELVQMGLLPKPSSIFERIKRTLNI